MMSEINSRMAERPNPKIKSWIGLCVFSGVIVWVWCVGLSTYGDSSAAQQRVARQQRLGIDPAALFYTDLAVAEEAFDRWEKFSSKHPSALWLPGAVSSGADVNSDARSVERP